MLDHVNIHANFASDDTKEEFTTMTLEHVDSKKSLNNIYTRRFKYEPSERRKRSSFVTVGKSEEQQNFEAYELIGAVVELDLKEQYFDQVGSVTEHVNDDVLSPARILDYHETINCKKFWMHHKDAIRIKSIVYDTECYPVAAVCTAVQPIVISEQNKMCDSPVMLFDVALVKQVVFHPHKSLLCSSFFVGNMNAVGFNCEDLCEPHIIWNSSAPRPGVEQYYFYNMMKQQQYLATKSAEECNVVFGVLIHGGSRRIIKNESPIRMTPTLALEVKGSLGHTIIYVNDKHRDDNGNIIGVSPRGSEHHPKFDVRSLFIRDTNIHPMLLPLMARMGYSFMSGWADKLCIEKNLLFGDGTPNAYRLPFNITKLHVQYFGSFKRFQSHKLQKESRGFDEAMLPLGGGNMMPMMIESTLAQQLSIRIREEDNSEESIDRLKRSDFDLRNFNGQELYDFFSRMHVDIEVGKHSALIEQKGQDLVTAKIGMLSSAVNLCQTCSTFIPVTELDGTTKAKVSTCLFCSCEHCKSFFCCHDCKALHQQTQYTTECRRLAISRGLIKEPRPSGKSAKKEKKERRRSQAQMEHDETNRKHLAEQEEKAKIAAKEARQKYIQEQERKRRERQEIEEKEAEEKAKMERDRHQKIVDERAERKKREEASALASEAAHKASRAAEEEKRKEGAAVAQEIIEAATTEERRQAALHYGHKNRDREALARDFNARQVEKHTKALEEKEERRKQRIKEQEAEKSMRAEAQQHKLPPKPTMSLFIS